MIRPPIRAAVIVKKIPIHYHCCHSLRRIILKSVMVAVAGGG